MGFQVLFKFKSRFIIGEGYIGHKMPRLICLTAKINKLTNEADHISLDAIIFAGYLDGLRDAGWHGDARLARFGYAATAAFVSGVAGPAIKFPSIARRVAALPAGEEPPRLLGPGRAQHAALRLHLLDLGEEARALIEGLV